MEDRNKKIQLHIHNSSNSIMHMQCLLISGDRRKERVCVHVHVMCVSAERGEEGEGRKGEG